MSDAQEAQVQPTPLDQRRVPINSDYFHRWLDSIRSKYEFDESVVRLFGEDVTEAIRLGLSLVQPWINDASINIVKDPGSFKLAAKRKAVGIGEMVRNIFYNRMQKCTDAINMLKHMENISPEDKKVRESVKECLEVVKTGVSLIIAFMVAIDTLSGALTANMPEPMIPNPLKGRVGYFSG